MKRTFIKKPVLASTSSQYREIQIRMYGDYLCSCGCGRPLGSPYVGDRLNSICYGVGEVSDEEGFRWRMFTKECWERIQSECNFDLATIYNTYPVCYSKEDGR